MNVYDQQFRQRASRIPTHGLGLSVDVYSPPLIELTQELNRQQLPFGYLEIFKAPVSALEIVRASITCPYFEYHADGLWVTQPDLWNAYPVHEELDGVKNHLRSLDCYWVNQECASKQMAGYSFGTYLPPLLTRLSAEMTAFNARVVQDRLDADCRTGRSVSPLFLLETPPLTYFACGDLSYVEFFRAVAAQSSCGLVLDIGHLWTVYRYAGYAQTQGISEFVEMFASEFPLHRVVQIHLAGLREHEKISKLQEDKSGLPAWIDAHDASIPDELFVMLEQILWHGELPCLKGIALEVDTKPIPRILEDYTTLREKLTGWDAAGQLDFGNGTDNLENLNWISAEECCRGPQEANGKSLLQAYGNYVKRITHGLVESPMPELDYRKIGQNGLQAYSQYYLPFEILEWGGNLREMFPVTCAALERGGIELWRFLAFWFQESRPNTATFDFFLLKIQRFVEFVRTEAPGVVAMAEKEAEGLREAYAFANQITP